MDQSAEPASRSRSWIPVGHLIGPTNIVAPFPRKGKGRRAEVTATVIADGVEIDGTSILEQFLAEFPVNNATFTCTGDGVIVDFPVVGTTASVPMVPT